MKRVNPNISTPDKGPKQSRLREKAYIGTTNFLMSVGVGPFVQRVLGERFISRVRDFFLQDSSIVHRCGDTWGERVALVEQKIIRGWLDWEFVEIHHIRPQVSGDKDVYYTQYLFDKYLKHAPPQRCLSLGCGGGNLERGLLKMGLGEYFDAIDASEGSIELARELTVKEGLEERINYSVADINKLRLKENWYDFVIAKMSLHHFRELDHVYAEIRRSLKPEGIFCFNEFVGPSRFQWTGNQLEIANEILQLLPEKYRRSLVENRVIDSIGRPTIEAMLRIDPTEAIRSEEIIPRLTKHFDIVERKDYGGTILHLLFNHIMDNFDTTFEEQATIISLICWFERRLLKEGVISSDFTFIVAKPKPFSSLGERGGLTRHR